MKKTLQGKITVYMNTEDQIYFCFNFFPTWFKIQVHNVIIINLCCRKIYKDVICVTAGTKEGKRNIYTGAKFFYTNEIKFMLNKITLL